MHPDAHHNPNPLDVKRLGTGDDPMEEPSGRAPHGRATEETPRGQKHATAVHGIMDGMDPEEVDRARDVLGRLLALLDAGELDANGEQVAAIRGALTVLESLPDAPPVQ